MRVKKIHQFQHIDAEEVRHLCIRHQYYTRGCNAEYCFMFQKIAMINEDVTLMIDKADLYELALDIACHSVLGKPDKEMIEEIMAQIYNECVHFVFTIEEATI